jgi:hypothetical protein
MADQSVITESSTQSRPSHGVVHPVREGRLARLRRHARRRRLHTLSRVTAYAEAAGLIALAVVVGAWIGHAF